MLERHQLRSEALTADGDVSSDVAVSLAEETGRLTVGFTGVDHSLVLAS